MLLIPDAAVQSVGMTGMALSIQKAVDKTRRGHVLAAGSDGLEIFCPTALIS